MARVRTNEAIINSTGDCIASACVAKEPFCALQAAAGARLIRTLVRALEQENKKLGMAWAATAGGM